ncbi:MAG: PQQ-like beta-propeller repeat protein [Myxococcaceae bacterium]|nr:PQQ-like beta-propeller repeat protein [Myxococcaceae bacterium]MCI0673046.1 PQQ-like beta-propeller repeat protein [Myxococcaceae bacterium]
MTSRRLVLISFLALSACAKPLEPTFVHSTNAPSRTGLLPVDGGALVGNEAGAVVRLGVDGGEVWRVSLQREVAVLPAVADGVVVAGTVEGEWVGVSLSDGKERWHQVDSPPLTVPLAVLGPHVFAVSPEGGVRGIHAATGGTTWALLPPLALRRAPPTAPLPGPVVCGETVVVALGPAGVVGLAPEDGERRWSHPFTDVTGLACSGALVLVGRASGALVALEGTSGRETWTQRLGERMFGPPVVAGERVWARTGPRTVVGAPVVGHGAIESVAAPMDIAAPPAVDDGLMVLAAEGREGRVFGLQLPGGKRLFDVRVDSRLPAAPLVKDGRLWVSALDGRVLGFTVKPPGR